jgi:hypothetical protein
MTSHKALFSAVIITLLIAGAFLVGCGGSKSSQTVTPSSTMGTVTTTLSDPSTCTAPQGPYSHVYVTVTDVQISSNANAGDNDSSFIDLTPALKSAPVQVDLLGAATSQCFLATLGTQTQLQPGTYQQIRIFLQDNSASAKPTGNKCGSDSNCVVLAGVDSTRTLQLSSESKTGIKIPSGQFAGGNFTIAAGQTKSLNIDFDACASIVVQGNGQFRLKPVLHAGEVSSTSTAISGKIVDKATGAAIVGGKTVVALEQKDANGVDRVILQTVPDASGNFTFCPVPAGTYDVVAVAVNGAAVAYAATITTGVQPGAALGNVPLTAQVAPGTAQASITGQVTTSKGATAATADVALAVLQTVTIGGSNVQVTIPLAQQSSATATVATAASASCPLNTNCASYTLQVPAANPTVGAFSSSGTTYTAGAAGTVSYSINAQAFVPSSGGTADCSPSTLTSAPVVVTPGASVAAATLAFTGCQ